MADLYRQTSDELSFLISATPGVLYTSKPESDLGAIFISPSVKAQTGYDPGDFTGEPKFWADHIHPEDKERVLTGLGALFEKGHHTHEYRFCHADGSYRWMHDQLSLLRDPNGKSERIAGLWIDITDRKNLEQRLEKRVAERTEKLQRANQALVKEVEDRKQAETSLSHSEGQYKRLIDNLPGYVYMSDYNRGWNSRFCSASFWKLIDLAPDDIINNQAPALGDLIHPDDRERVWTSVQKDFAAHKPCEIQYRIITPSGTEKWVWDRAQGIYDADGNAIRLEGYIEDITVLHKQNDDLLERDKALSEKNMHFNAALDNMSQGLCMFDDKQRLVVCNQRYASMYDLSPEQVKPGTLFRQILEYRIASGVYAGDDPENYIQERCAAVTEAEASTKIQKLTDGRSIVMSYQPLVNGGWLATHEDITNYQRIEQRLAYLDYHDELTDLPNRVLLSKRLEKELNRTRRGDGFALFRLDLDGLNDVNGTLGYSACDEVLKAVAQRLRDCIRETDMVARLDGDEFAIVQASKKLPSNATALADPICDAISAPDDLEHSQDVATLARRIVEAISAPHEIDGHQIVIGASIGIALAPNDGDTAEKLLQCADLALYRAKELGRGEYCFFELALNLKMRQRQALEADLRRALEANQFELHYQPLVSLTTQEICSVEALVRWRHPERGMISPLDFIPLAEETGLIVPIGEWVIRQACETVASWPGHVRVAVNLSSVQFKKPGLVPTIVNALASSQLDPRRLEFEITESLLLDASDAVLATLHQLRALGATIALDDFGTGYSSLSYLQSFPFDKLKIDRSFIKNLGIEQSAIDIVKAIVAMAQALRDVDHRRRYRDRAATRSRARLRMQRLPGLPLQSTAPGPGNRGAAPDEKSGIGSRSVTVASRGGLALFASHWSYRKNAAFRAKINCGNCPIYGYFTDSPVTRESVRGRPTPCRCPSVLQSL